MKDQKLTLRKNERFVACGKCIKNIRVVKKGSDEPFFERCEECRNDVNKLVAPNENYEVAICRNPKCGKEYIKRINNSSKQLAPGIRGWRMKCCSKKCTREDKRTFSKIKWAKKKASEDKK